MHVFFIMVYFFKYFTRISLFFKIIFKTICIYFSIVYLFHVYNGGFNRYGLPPYIVRQSCPIEIHNNERNERVRE